MADRPGPWALAALWTLNLTTAVQFLIVAPILPRIAEALEVEQALLGTLITAYAFAFGVTALVAGPVSDHVGRRRVLVWGSGAMTVALLLHGLATSFPALLAVRALAGLCSGSLSGASVAYISDAFPQSARGEANGWVASAFAAGQVLGIPVGTLLAGYGYQLPFVAFAAVGAVAFVLTLVALPDPDVPLSEELSVASALRGYASLLKVPGAVGSVVVFVLLFSGVASFITYLPTWFEESLGATSSQVASLFMVGGLANAVSGPLAGRLSDRFGRKPLAIGGSAVTGVLMGGMAFVVAELWQAYVFFVVVMVFVAMRVAPLQALVGSLVPPSQRGSLLSLCFATGQMVGFGGGSALAGVMYGSPGGFAASGLLAAALTLTMAAVIAAALPETLEVDAIAAPTR